MVLSTESRVTSAWSYSQIHEVHFEDPPTDDDSEASTQEVQLGYVGRPSVISFRAHATISVLLVATVAYFTAMSYVSLSSKFFFNDDGGDGLMTIGMVEAATGGNKSNGDILVRVCRDENCDKFHPHGLVHEYTAFLNKCSAISSNGSTQTNGKYKIIGATSAATLGPGIILTADHCNGNSSTGIVQHHPFTLAVGEFTDCCSFEQGGCGFKCITFALNEVPPAYGGDGMDGGDIRIKVCRNEDCDKIHPHGLVHEYTAKLNKCARVSEDTNSKTNGEYEVIGATAATLAEGTILTAKHCGNTTERVQHGPFSLIVGQFTDCCSFRHGGCGFKCITFKQVSEPGANGTMPDNSTAMTTVAAANTSVAAANTTAAAASTTVAASSSIAAAASMTTAAALNTTSVAVTNATTMVVSN